MTNPNTTIPVSNTENTLLPKRSNYSLIIAILLIILILVLSVGIFLFWNNSKEKSSKPNDESTSPSIVPSVVPTVEDTSLKTYTGDTGFIFTYSDISWTFSEEDISVDVPGLEGLQEYTQIKLSHNLENYELVINYKPKVSDSDMTLYGGAAGEFILNGSVEFMGEDLTKYALNWNNQNRALHYNRGLGFTRGETTFTMVLQPLNFEDYVNDGIIEQADYVLKSFGNVSIGE